MTARAAFGEPVGEIAYNSTIDPAAAEYVLIGGSYEDWVNNAYKRNEVVAGCLNLMINTLLQAPIGVKDARSGEWLENHDMLTLLQHVNDDQTWREFITTLVLHLYLGSVAFVEKVRDNSGKLTEFGLLRPDRVILNTNTRGIVDYTYTPSEKPVRIDKDNVVFMRFVDPFFRFKGHSPLHSLATRIDTENEATDLNKSSLQNMGAPGTLIRFEGRRSDDEKRAAARSFDNRFKGSGAGSTLAFDEDIVEISPFGESVKGTDLSSMVSVNESRILSTLQVPVAVYGSVSGQQASTFDNMRTSLRMFWMHNIIPLQNMIEDYLNKDKDFSADGTIQVAFDRRDIEALAQDKATTSQIAREDYKAGIRTLNEARRASDELGDTEDGDEFFSQPSFGFDLGDDEEEDTTEEEESKHVQLNKTIQKDESQSCGCGTHDEEAIIEELNKEDDSIPTNDRDLLHEYKTAVQRFRIADAAALPLVRMVDAELKQQIKDMTNLIGGKEGKALKNFEQSRLEDGLAILEQQWEARMFADSLELMGKLYAATADQASASVGGVFDIESENIQKAIQAEQYKFASRVSKTSAKQIRGIISDTFAEGKTLGEVSKAVKDLGKVWQGGRADTVARTETARAANEGAKMGYREAGVTKLRYTAVLDDRTTEICKALDGKIVGIEEKFLSAEEGFTDSKGNAVDLSYNDGVPNAGSAHPNCRSTIVAVFESTEGGF
jgi:HK97 family phage portal protein